MRVAHVLVAMAVVTSLASQAEAQTMVPPPVKTVKLSGPRFGFTSLSDRSIAQLRETGVELRPLITQFGWQFEKQFYTSGGGLTAVNEWVMLFGGLEQGVAIPSLSWMVGLRTSEGAEFGFGPNVSPNGVALAVAAGVTFRAGALNVPVNVAVVPSRNGTRVSMLSGFNFRGRR